MVGVRVSVAEPEPPGGITTWLLGEKAVLTPGGILSTVKVTVAPGPVELISRLVVALPSGGIGGSQLGSALMVKAASCDITWKCFMMKTGGSPDFWASTSMSYQPGPVEPPHSVLGTLKTRVKSPLLSAAVFAGTGKSIPAKRRRVTLAPAG